jgi:hypothetical protein
MRRRIGPGLLVLILSVCGAAPSALGHGMRTGYLELLFLSATEVQLRWRAPDSAAATAAGTIELALPGHCQQILANGQVAPRRSASISLRDRNFRGAFHLRCAQPLAGETLRLSGLGPQLSEVVGMASLSDGSAVSHLLTAAAPSWRIGSSRDTRQVAAEYVELGLRHILSGADHLLFLLLLVLAVRRVRVILLAETAFTLSHSLSFSVTALGWVQVSAPAAEACIALSLLLLALDVERPGVPLLSAWRATTLALGFGLVHGLGFAGGLREIGLPEHAAAWALLGFGVGVELGQLAFLLLLVGILHLFSGTRVLRPAARGAAYVAGGFSAYWLIERTLLCLGAFGPFTGSHS